MCWPSPLPLAQAVAPTTRPFDDLEPRLVGTIALELIIAAMIGVAAHLLLSRVVRRLLARTPFNIFDVAFDELRRPTSFALPLLFMLLARSRATR